MFKRLLLAFLFLGMGAAHAFMPQTGTWIVSAELDGKPGRGIALDVQNNTLVMQMYAYDSNGQSTFYLGVGQLDSNVRATFPLTRYTGGRYFGSGPRSGAAAGSPGNVSLRFTSGMTGFATFPGEPERAIERFSFAYERNAASLFGIWNFTSFGGLGLIADVTRLERNLGPTSSGNGLVASSDASFACEHKTTGSLVGTVLCIRLNSAGQLLRTYLILAASVNDGEGLQLNSGGADTGQVVFARRLTTPNGSGTGIFYKEEPASNSNFEALRQQFNVASANAEAQ